MFTTLTGYTGDSFFSPANSLVWGSLRLTPIKNFSESYSSGIHTRSCVHGRYEHVGGGVTAGKGVCSTKRQARKNSLVAGSLRLTPITNFSELHSSGIHSFLIGVHGRCVHGRYAHVGVEE